VVSDLRRLGPGRAPPTSADRLVSLGAPLASTRACKTLVSRCPSFPHSMSLVGEGAVNIGVAVRLGLSSDPARRRLTEQGSIQETPGGF
jgi:hypothetical protein